MNALIIALAFTFLAASPAAPRSGDENLTKEQMESIRENITRNLEHHIPNIRANSLQLLIDLHASHPEIDLSFAQLPAMRILKHDDDEGLRILAAVALFHIGDRRGRYAVQRRALYDGSQRVARQCTRLFRYWGTVDVPGHGFAGTPVKRVAESAQTTPES
jgi:hypothetical protein